MKAFIMDLVSTPWKFGVLCLLFNFYYIKRFWYWEIDWTSYMAQVTLFREGERDYTKLVGPQGPANYPAGFIYVYWVMQVLSGEDPALGQFISCFIYAFLQYIGMKIFEMIYKKEDLWKLAILSMT